MTKSQKRSVTLTPSTRCLVIEIRNKSITREFIKNTSGLKHKFVGLLDKSSHALREIAMRVRIRHQVLRTPNVADHNN